MLDVLALQRQIHRMVQEQVEARDDAAARLDRAVREFDRQGACWREFSERVAESRTSWLLAGVCEPLNERPPCPLPPGPHTVLATDGSQIFPDRHEGAACYLINIGRVAVPYGQPRRPLLDSQPTLFYRDRDLYHFWGGRRTPINDEVVGVRRQLMELEALARLAPEDPHREHPAVALSDGTLILWTLEGVPSDFRQEVLDGFRTHLDRFFALRVPLVGYISHPASTDVINALRVAICPEGKVNCDRCPWKGKKGEEKEGKRRKRGERVGEHQLVFFQHSAEVLPCAAVEGITDAVLFAQVLSPGERSAVFRSSSRILSEYGPHAVHFFYLHGGWEIARVEVPEWVVTQPDLLERVHTVLVDQIEKGRGYPLALIEAHEKAVVRSGEREAFFRILQDSLVRRGLPDSLSSKGWSKRVPRI